MIRVPLKLTGKEVEKRSKEGAMAWTETPS